MLEDSQSLNEILSGVKKIIRIINGLLLARKFSWHVTTEEKIALCKVRRLFRLMFYIPHVWKEIDCFGLCILSSRRNLMSSWTLHRSSSEICVGMSRKLFQMEQNEIRSMYSSLTVLKHSDIYDMF